VREICFDKGILYVSLISVKFMRRREQTVFTNTGVSEIRVLILTSGRMRQIMELFSITFLRKSTTN
jgi:hypothetical protein